MLREQQICLDCMHPLTADCEMLGLGMAGRLGLRECVVYFARGAAGLWERGCFEVAVVVGKREARLSCQLH